MKRRSRVVAGRPAEFRQRARLVVFLEAQELAAVHERAELERVSVSMFARSAILEALAEGRKRKMPKVGRPLRFTERELAKFGVEITDSHRVWLRCTNCGQGWSPNLLSGGRMPRGYWKCPNECNWQ